MRSVARCTRTWAIASVVILAGTAFVGVSSSQSFVREGDGGPETKARIDGPSKLAFDAAGNLYIYENSGGYTAVIREIPAGTNTIKTHGLDAMRRLGQLLRTALAH